MVQFLRKIIASGDTLQSIAQHHLGDVSRWRELATLNNLRYPYIVETNQEKLKNPNHLLTIGDTILYRVEEGNRAQIATALKNGAVYDKEEIYAMALGKDLYVLPKPDERKASGWDSEILGLTASPTKDLQTIQGINNLKQSLLTRLLTPRGSYLNHPNYGSFLSDYLGGKSTEENITIILAEIERTIRTDGRVKTVERVNYYLDGNTLVVSLQITAISIDDAFDMVLSAKDNGEIALLN